MNVNVYMAHAPVTFSTLASAMLDGQVSFAINKVAISRVKTAVKLSSMGLANATVPVRSIWPAITAKRTNVLHQIVCTVTSIWIKQVLVPVNVILDTTVPTAKPRIVHQISAHRMVSVYRHLLVQHANARQDGLGNIVKLSHRAQTYNVKTEAGALTLLPMFTVSVR